MIDLVSLIKRNIIVFLRDKAAVFFSFLSVIILLALYFLFIGKQYTSGEHLDFLDDSFKLFLSAGVMMGGILVINTVSLSLGMMGNLIMDLEQKKLDGFLVSPIKRYKIILGYYLSAIIVTSFFSILMWILTYIYVGVFSGYWYSVNTFIETTLLLVFFTFISSTFMVFLTTLIKSVNAFGTLSGVLGTFIGFVSGIYMPLFVLGSSMTLVASLIPFTHMAILLKKTLLRDPYNELRKIIPEKGLAEIEKYYGTVEIGILGTDVPILPIMLGIVIFSIILLYFAYKNMSNKISKH